MLREDVELVKQLARQIAKEEIALAIANLSKEVPKEEKVEDNPVA